MFMAAAFASLYYWAATHAIHNYFQILGVLAFFAASMAAEYYFSWMRHDAILELFLEII